MLRLFFCCAGVLFIGLGLFGGNVLEGFAGGKQTDAQLQLASNSTTEAGTTEAGLDETTAGLTVVETAAVSSATPATQVLPQVAAASPNDALQTASQTPEKNLAPQNLESQSVTSLQNQEGIETQVESADLADNSGGEGAVPVAPAQAAGDLIAMAEQAKSLSRNEQVGMVQSALEPNGVLPESVEVEVEGAEVGTDQISTSIPLMVIKDRVNLRDGPSIDHPVVLTMEKGQELMEFKREGKWVHVGAYGTSGKIGWVHQTLVGPQ